MRGAVEGIAKSYEKYSLWLIAVMMLIGLLAMQVAQDTSMLMPITVAVIFSLLCSVAYGHSWKAIARRSPSQLAKFYIVASALRMMAALLVALVGAVVLAGDKSQILGFMAVFGGFYIVLLVFDCIYFAQVEKKNNINNK